MPPKITEQDLIARGADRATAAATTERVNRLLDTQDAPACWREISQTVLTPQHPFAVHLYLYETIYENWDRNLGPPPAWIPDQGAAARTNIGRFMQKLSLNNYRDLHAWSVQNRLDFWAKTIAELNIVFKQPYTAVADLSAGPASPRWLPGARLNIADSCFTAPPDVPAVRYQQGNALNCMTYGELESLVNRVANGILSAGFSAGDPIAIVMPMTIQAVAAYLAIIKTGCVAVSIADSFAPDQIRTRLRLTQTRGVITQDHISRAGKRLPMYDRVTAADAPRAVVVPCAEALSVDLRNGDLAWNDFLSHNNRFESVPCDPHDHTNILFSSGTTGDPKAIPWSHTTPIKCAADGYFHQDIRPGDVLAWPTSLGWMMGPWLIYAALVNHGAIALYDDAPTGRGFGEFVQNAGVTMLGVVPSLVKAWKASNCLQGLDWTAIKAFSSTGECSNAEDMLFLMAQAGYKPVIEYCGGTEIGGGYITGTPVQPAAPAAFTTPALGLDLKILDENGRPAENGEVFLIPPSIGLSTELLNQDHHTVYFDGTPGADTGETLRRHGDQIESAGGGFYRVQGRVDDAMNLDGIKVSSAEIERTLAGTKGVRETAAVAVSPQDAGPSLLVIFTILEPGVETDGETLQAAMQDAIRQRLNPLFKIHKVAIVDALPRTASNKVMRRELRAMYQE